MLCSVSLKYLMHPISRIWPFLNVFHVFLLKVTLHVLESIDFVISTAALLSCQLQFLSVAEGIPLVTSTTTTMSSIPIASMAWVCDRSIVFLYFSARSDHKDVALFPESEAVPILWHGCSDTWVTTCVFIDPWIGSPEDFHLRNNDILQNGVPSSPSILFHFLTSLTDNMGAYVGKPPDSLLPFGSRVWVLCCLTISRKGHSAYLCPSLHVARI